MSTDSDDTILSSIVSLSAASISNQDVEIGIVPFDTIRFDNTDGSITYNLDTKKFTISESGTYLINFDVVYNSGSLSDSDIIFSLFLGSSSVGIASDPTTPSGISRLSATEIIQVDTTPIDVWAQCINVPVINLANTLTQANIVFTKTS